jgi:N-acetylglucosamine-6-phosphate deacetylase
MQVFFGARLFDGERFLDDHALIVEDGRIRALVDVEERPIGGESIDCGGGILAPGLIDWQINGGGGVLFNADPTVEGIRRIARAFRREGVTGLLPTVITDAPEVLDSALAAARAAQASVPGALGVHVEGPFIDPRRHGIHPTEWIRPMRERDADALIAAKAGVTLVTLAPASVPLPLIRRLAEAGVIVSLGHAEATAEEATAVFDAGARAATHLFNAMSQLNSRAPGVVGAILSDPRIICGLIADGEHVHPAACRAAIAAKGVGGIALVSDAMPPAAGGPASFELHGRTMTRVGLKLVDEHGTLAGAAITLRDAVRYAATTLGVPLEHALAMATATPARLLGLDHRVGRLAPGAEANLVHFTDTLDVRAVWMGGRPLDDDGEPV